MKKILIAFFLFLVGFLIWLPASDVVKLIVANQEVLFGRYSRPHFGGLFFLTLMLWIAAAVMAFSRERRAADVIFSILMIYFSTGISMFFLVVASGFFSKPPQFVERHINGADADTGIVVRGISRHRPPNERYELLLHDVPEQLRSYPDAPAGYPSYPVVLTSDVNGFRNPVVAIEGLREQYDVVVVGDSFVAGSHVSDDQAWTEMLRQQMGFSLYNLGVSGSHPVTYLNNFLLQGRKLKPATVVLMLYEGNDFRDVPALALQQPGAEPFASNSADIDISALTKASPVTVGLRRFSAEVLEKVGRNAAVPAYADAVGFMPLAIPVADGMRYYSFEPKRLLGLYHDEQQFSQSPDWINVRAVLEQFAAMAKKDNFRLIVMYAPSAPHVVLPLVADNIPAQQLLNFARYKKASLDMPAETFKQQVFARIDSVENVWKNWCVEVGVECVSTTRALRSAVQSGQQVYLTYDQHWTPDGNAVVAKLLQDYLQNTLDERFK
jgi:hypothetical protein